MTPTRSQLISDYWLNDMSHEEICRKHRMGRDRFVRTFRRYGILMRRVGGRGRGGGDNRERLELMLWPSVEEWKANATPTKKA